VSSVSVGGLEVGAGRPVFIAGPCVMESPALVDETAGFLSSLASRGVKVILKLSYEKANRSSGESFRGPGIEEGLKLIRMVKEKYGLPVICDIHCREEAEAASRVADCLQIPAFLCRQTPLIEAAGRTLLPVNIKKGQFLSPYSMERQGRKALETGASGVIFTERGTSFGYSDLVVDMRSVVIMKKSGFPVIFDATHSQQSPAGSSGETGGSREFIIPISKAAAAAGADGFFCEVHPRPVDALSDRSTQMDFNMFEEFVDEMSKM